MLAQPIFSDFYCRPQQRDKLLRALPLRDLNRLGRSCFQKFTLGDLRGQRGVHFRTLGGPTSASRHSVAHFSRQLRRPSSILPFPSLLVSRPLE
jgi:hypothetical protein